jgi:endogenous inhibitor of DNA gyrase (YacG/DUF329 family)
MNDTLQPEKVCPICGKILILLTGNQKKRKYCSFICSNAHKKKELRKFCLKCGKELTWTGRHRRRKYCSFICSNSHHNYYLMWCNSLKKLDRSKIGNHKPRTPEEIERLRKIAKIGGINSAKNQPKRSKGEIMLSNLLKENGYNVKNSVWNLINGYEIDMFLPDQNIAISYNGEVHRKPIYGEIRLKQVISRDSYRNRKLLEMGIRHIVIEDEGMFKEEKVKKQFEWCLEQLKQKETQAKNIVCLA